MIIEWAGKLKLIFLSVMYKPEGNIPENVFKLDVLYLRGCFLKNNIFVI